MTAANPPTLSPLERAARLWRTARHLRPIQVWNRLARRFVRGAPRDARSAALDLPRGRWTTPVAGHAVLVAANRARIHEVERDIAGASAWDPGDMAALWRYHLHYFDELGCVADAERRAWHARLIERWILENPPGRPPGWDAYPTSLRIVNWLKWALDGNLLGARGQESLALQCGWLERRLEFHLLGNHLFENAKALWFGGACFRGTAPQRWSRIGRSLVSAELGEQVLDDGGHSERSPMYHARMLENVLDLVNLERACGREPARVLTDAAVRMLDWLAVMSHPDGTYALLNDAAAGQAPTFAELCAYAEALGLAPPPAASSRWLASSGYVRMQRGPWAVIADLAPVGPDYQPGHAHADTLTFVASLNGRQLVVDTGTSTYENGAVRQYQRSTAAHNVLALAGVDSSEVWGAFRVGRRARVHDVTVRLDGPESTATAWHDGYVRSNGPGACRRTWRLHGRTLDVDDELDGTGFADLQWHLHLHPDVRVSPAGETRFLLERDARVVAEFAGDAALRWSVERCTHYPRFGVSQAAFRITGVARARLPITLHAELSAVTD